MRISTPTVTFRITAGVEIFVRNSPAAGLRPAFGPTLSPAVRNRTVRIVREQQLRTAVFR